MLHQTPVEDGYMGEAKRRKDSGREVKYPLMANCVLIQRGVEHIERLKHEMPKLFCNERFAISVDAWGGQRASASCEFLLFGVRMDGREISQQVIDTRHLTETILPRLFGEFHARRQCCNIRTFISVESADLIAPLLNHQHQNANGATIGLQWQQRSSPIHGNIGLVRIPRRAVARKEISGLLLLMDSLVANGETLQSCAQKILLAFEGYDRDPREVFEIEEVRQFLQEVCRYAPWWVILAHPATYIMWFGAVMTYTGLVKDHRGIISFKHSPGEMERVLSESLPRAGELMRDLRIEEDDAETLNANLSLALGDWVAGKSQPGSDILKL